MKKKASKKVPPRSAYVNYNNEVRQIDAEIHDPKENEKARMEAARKRNL